MFYVGQKVVCVAEGIWKSFREQGFSVPVRGGIYTIRESYICPYGNIPGIRLIEVRNPRCVGPLELEIGFYPQEFRPVVERKTDISIFTRMLNPSQEKVTV
jgi:hypothetical protein